MKRVAANGTTAFVLAAFAVLVLVAFANRALLARGGTVVARNQTDFIAFYCAARVRSAGADSYPAEPLRTCEAESLASLGSRIVPYLVVPAPLPPYALALFAPLALLPFQAAAGAWFCILLMATGATFVLLRRLTDLPPLALFFPLLFADAFASLAIGQLVPVVVCFVCAAALALRAQRTWPAAAFASATLLEPNVGLPLCVAAFVWQPELRRALLACVCVLALFSLAYGGLHDNLEYLSRVAPAQARAEGLSFVGQYSLSALLFQAGVAAGLALQLGFLSYIAMAAAGIVLAGRLAAVLADRALVVLTPPAFALIGGAYVHIHQMAFALPLAFVLIAWGGAWRPLLVAALFCLAVPWQSFAEMPFFANRLPPRPYVDARIPMRAAADGTRLAEDEWGVWESLAVRDRRTPAQRLATKLPTWFGLLALAFAALAVGSAPLQPESRARASRASLRATTRA